MILAPNGQPARQHLRSQSLGEAFDAAKRSGYRTWFFFPSLDPSDQLKEMDREEANKKKSWLYNNCPAVHGLINGMAREEVDTGIWPRAKTSSRPFNKAVTDAFESDCSDARFFDEAGIDHYYDAQEAIRRNCYIYDDYFGQLLRPGEGSRQPSMNFIPSWQVGSPRKRGSSSLNSQLSTNNWVDGVRTNEMGRPIEYWVYTNKNRSEGVPVPAGDMLHFHDKMLKGARRPVSCLTTAVRKLFDIDDLSRAANYGELVRQRIAYQITRGIADDDEPTMVPGGEVVETIETENPDGTKTKNYIQRITSKDGTDIDVADLGPGREIKMVESGKGGDAKEWSEHVLLDVARCTPYPPEYCFSFADVVQGTVYRGLGKRVQRAKNNIRQFQLIPQFCKRWYNFWLWQNIAKGRFDDIEGGVPQDWFLVKWILPADDSVDVGREGALYDDRLDSGKMTLSVYHGMQNSDAEDDEDEIIDDRIRRLKKIEDRRAELEGRTPDYKNIAAKVDYDLIFRESKSAGTATLVANSNAEEDDIGGTAAPAKNNSSNGHRARFARV